MNSKLNPLLVDFFTHHPASKKDPRLYSLSKHFRDTNLKEGSELGVEDVSRLYEFGNRVILLSVFDEHFLDPEKRSSIEAQSIYVFDVLDMVIRKLFDKHKVLYRTMSRVRVGGRLLSNSVMGRDFDPEVYGDVYMRILYRGYKHTRLVFALNPCHPLKAMLLHQDGLVIFSYDRIVMENMYVEQTESGLYYISGLVDGSYTVESKVRKDGSVQINIGKSKE